MINTRLCLALVALLLSGLAGAQPTTLRVDGRTDPQTVLTQQKKAVQLVSSSDSNDLAFCAPIPNGGIPGVANKNMFFLSEIGGCAQLACFLHQVAHQGGVHADSTLIIDQVCHLRQPITLPDRFTLAGVGMDGAGKLSFELPDNTSAIRVKPAPGAAIRHATVRDLDIQNAACCGQVGINVSNSNLVYLDRVRLMGFGFGVYGDVAYSTFIDHSNISDNGFNVVLGEDTTAWRLRDSVFRGGWMGIVMSPTSRGNVVSGGRFESSLVTAIWLAGAMNVVETSWFEGNGGAALTAIRVSGEHNRIMGNLFSSQTVANQGTDTQRCLNMAFEPDPQQLNACSVKPAP
jgi:hypothetical protein